MKKTRVADLAPGMAIGKDIYNDRGDVLLARGVSLTPRFIEALDSLGYYAVYVLDGIADDLEPPDFVTDRVRIAAGKHLRNLFSLARGAGAMQTVPMAGVEPSRVGPSTLAAAAAPRVAELHRAVERIIDGALSTHVLSGVACLKSHDNFSFDHSVEVAVVGTILGIRLKLGTEDLHQIALGCLCHDIGKTAVPQEILSKNGPLREDEYEQVKQHPQAGYDIMRQITSDADIVARHIVWQHHERQDGTGYPRGLGGINEFGYPKFARYRGKLMLPGAEIAALAEVYCSLVSDLCYRPALPQSQAIDVIRRSAGRELNTEIVRRFLALVPPFPIGTRVSIMAGEYQGHEGVVTRIDPADVSHPTIRLISGPKGERIQPVEVDTGQMARVALATIATS